MSSHGTGTRMETSAKPARVRTPTLQLRPPSVFQSGSFAAALHIFSRRLSYPVLRGAVLGNDGQNQRGRMLAVVVNRVRGLYHLPAGFGVFSGIQIPVKAGKIAAGNFHAQLVAFQEDVGG